MFYLKSKQPQYGVQRPLFPRQYWNLDTAKIFVVAEVTQETPQKP